jgi:hypothetical protein
VHSIRNSIETKAENNRLEAKQYPAIQRNLTKNTIDSGTGSKTRKLGGRISLFQPLDVKFPLPSQIDPFCSLHSCRFSSLAMNLCGQKEGQKLKGLPHLLMCHPFSLIAVQQTSQTFEIY